jgi:hypothetical protein
MSAGKDYPKVKAKMIHIDSQRWQWNVPKGGGYVISDRKDLPDGRIQFTLGDASQMVVNPDDYIRAKRHWHGWWNDANEFGYIDLEGKWVVMNRM